MFTPRSWQSGVVKEGVSAAANPPCSSSTAGRDSVMVCLLTDDVDTYWKIAAGGRCSVEQTQRLWNALESIMRSFAIRLASCRSAALSKSQ